MTDKEKYAAALDAQRLERAERANRMDVLESARWLTNRYAEGSVTKEQYEACVRELARRLRAGPISKAARPVQWQGVPR